MTMLKNLLVALFSVGAVAAQSSTQFCDSSSGICFQGYTDPELDVTVGFVLPPETTPASNEFIVQMVAPVANGYTGISVGGTMANSLLFTLWPFNNEFMLAPRWTSGYTLPTLYSGPTVTLLPSSSINSTHIKATFRCQNCTTWEGGSLGDGDLTSFSVVAYVVATTTKPTTPSDPGSVIQEHDDFDFFGLDLSMTHSNSYSSYISGSASSSSSKPTTTSRPTTTSHSTSTVASTTSSAPAAVQTEYGQCGGVGYTGPTTCASGLKCVAVSPPYYSQCQAA